jgi:hypothetical protein
MLASISDYTTGKKHALILSLIEMARKLIFEISFHSPRNPAPTYVAIYSSK